jgi:hypothetical protein
MVAKGSLETAPPWRLFCELEVFEEEFPFMVMLSGVFEPEQIRGVDGGDDFLGPASVGDDAALLCDFKIFVDQRTGGC